MYLLACLLCFGAGAYIWKVNNSGLMLAPSEAAMAAVGPARPNDFPMAMAVVEVGGERITKEDIDWEYALLTDGATDRDTLTPIPDLGARYGAEMGSLRRSLVATLIERKMLYHFLKRDRDFSFDDPARYTACMSDWQGALREKPFLDASRSQKDRLKARLCERSLLDQYLRERLFASLVVSDAEMVEYYKNHYAEFKRPERVKIRHILLGDEQSARKWRAQATIHNFETLAREHSLAPEKDRGGLLGPFARGAMPTVFEVAFLLQPGAISDVLKSNYGYHILMVVERLAKQQLSLEAARPKIKAVLLQQKKEEAYGKWIEKALAAIDVRTQQRSW